jgi:hypothetical protein
MVIYVNNICKPDHDEQVVPSSQTLIAEIDTNAVSAAHSAVVTSGTDIIA